MTDKRTVRFAAVGLNHGHIYGQTNALLGAGAELACFFAKEPELAAQYHAAYQQAKLGTSVQAILEDESIDLIITAGIPCERAELGIAAMRHGKDFIVTSRASPVWRNSRGGAQAETGRIID